MAGLDSQVLVLESDVSAQLGATLDLNLNQYTLFGLLIPQSDFLTLINYSAMQERNELGDGVYLTGDVVLKNAVKNYQMEDSAFRIIRSMPGRIPMGWFDSSVGDQRITPTLTIINGALTRQKEARDRAFNQLQTMLTMIDVNQPGYGNTQAALY